MNTRFEWDARKALTNQVKHGVSFEEASSPFLQRPQSDKMGTPGLRRETKVLNDRAKHRTSCGLNTASTMRRLDPIGLLAA